MGKQTSKEGREKVEAVRALLSVIRNVIDQSKFDDALTKYELYTALTLTEAAALRWHFDVGQ